MLVFFFNLRVASRELRVAIGLAKQCRLAQTPPVVVVVVVGSSLVPVDRRGGVGVCVVPAEWSQGQEFCLGNRPTQ